MGWTGATWTRLAVIFCLLACFAAGATDAGRDPWRVLGLRRGHVTPQQVRAAYLRLARQLHPDKNRGNAPAQAAHQEECFKRVQSAYEEITSGLYSTAAGDSCTMGHDSAGAAAAADFSSFVPGSGSMRRAGSAPEQKREAGHGSQSTGGGSRDSRAANSAGVFSSVEHVDIRVFTDTVSLEDMEFDLDEDSFVLECRCSGRYMLPSDSTQLTAHQARIAINCQLCSLWIWVLVSPT